MTRSAAIQSHRIRLLWAGFAFLYLAIGFFCTSHAPVSDELVHYGQINRFDHGDFRIGYQYLTMLPGYHFLAASILWLTDLRTLAAARLLNAVFGLLTVYAFHLLRRRAFGVADGAATLQFALLPILFPYDFLVFTDVVSLGLVLAAGVATLRERRILAGTLMIAAMAVRQNNVIWLPLYACLALWPAGVEIPSLRLVVSRCWPYLAGMVLFLAYWAWNGSISLSKEQTVMHPDFQVHVGNVYFALFMAGALLPLQVVVGLESWAAKIARRPWLLIVPLAAFVAYWLLFRVDHPFNLVAEPWMLHNHIILLCDANPVWKAAFGLIAVAAACGLAGTKLQPRMAWMLYPLALIALASFWMVEHRYALIPFALWLAFRERRSDAIEYATTALWAVLAVCFCLGIFSGRFSL
jgi:alpha-1,2-glucosyltransferase